MRKIRQSRADYFQRILHRNYHNKNIDNIAVIAVRWSVKMPELISIDLQRRQININHFAGLAATQPAHQLQMHSKVLTQFKKFAADH